VKKGKGGVLTGEHVLWERHFTEDPKTGIKEGNKEGKNPIDEKEAIEAIESPQQTAKFS